MATGQWFLFQLLRFRLPRACSSPRGLDGKVGVQSIETFVGTNIEEISGFSTSGIRRGVARLIRKYNERIALCEADQSLRIDEPEWISDELESIILYGTVDE